MSVYQNINGTLARIDASDLVQLAAVDTEGILGGTPGATTDGQTLVDQLAADDVQAQTDIGQIKTDLSDYCVVPSHNLWKPNSALATTTSADVKYTPVYTESGLIDYVDIDGTASGRSALIYTQYADNMRFAEGTYRMDVPVGVTGVNIKYRNDSNSEITLATVSPANPNFTITSAAANRPLMTEIVVTSGTVMSHVKLYPMIKTAADYAADPSYEPYFLPMRDGKFDITDEQILGAWNLAKITVSTQTINGATFTVNADKSITVTKSSAGANDATLYTSDIFDVEAGRTYYLSGCPAGGAASGSYRLIYQEYDGTTWKSNNNDIGNGLTITTSYSKARLCIDIAKAYIISGSLTFNIMLALKPNMPYVAPAMTNRELTESVKTTISSITTNSNFTKTAASAWYKRLGNLVEVYLEIDCSTAASSWVTVLSSILPQASDLVYGTVSPINSNGTTLYFVLDGSSFKLRYGNTGMTYPIHFTYIAK